MADKPNILLVGIDSLRADYMSCYGHGRMTTPHMDRLAMGGTLFENNFAPNIPTTPFGRACAPMAPAAPRSRSRSPWR